MAKTPALPTEITVTSLDIAKVTDKRHDNVCRDIREMLDKLEIEALKFEELEKHSTGERTVYRLPKNLVMALMAKYDVVHGYAMAQKIEAQEEKLNARQRGIEDRAAAKLDNPEMNAALKDMREQDGKETKHFHYSNEANMINKIVMGCSAKKYRESQELEKDDSLRDNMIPTMISAITDLQSKNITLIEIGMPYDERKVHLSSIFDKKHDRVIIEEYEALEA